MRIALIAPLVAPIGEPNLGGAQTVVCDLARELSQRGHDVSVYAARGSALEGAALIPVDVAPGALAEDVARPGVERPASAAMTAAYEALYDDVAAAGYDVVHNHGFDAPAITTASARGTAALHTLHLPPSRLIADALETARRSAPVWVAAVSFAHARAWRALTAVDAVLRNGVPLDDIPFVATGGAAVVMAARFSAEKGMGEGITAARLAGMAVDVFGIPYDSGYERLLREGWRDDLAVRFHPATARTAIWSALGDAAAVVCLSTWDEPFGMVAAEAQAAGTPVVASASGGLVEVVFDGVSGYLVTPGDTRAAADALPRAVALDRRECRRHAEASLGLATAVDAHEELYARLVRDRAGRHGERA